MPTSKRALNIAMIGHGFIAAVHSNAFHQVDRFFPGEFQLHTKVVCGRDQASLQSMAARWGWQETTAEWESVIHQIGRAHV